MVSSVLVVILKANLLNVVYPFAQMSVYSQRSHIIELMFGWSRILNKKMILEKIKI